MWDKLQKNAFCLYSDVTEWRRSVSCFLRRVLMFNVICGVVGSVERLQITVEQRKEYISKHVYFALLLQFAVLWFCWNTDRFYLFTYITKLLACWGNCCYCSGRGGWVGCLSKLYQNKYCKPRFHRKAWWLLQLSVVSLFWLISTFRKSWITKRKY